MSRNSGSFWGELIAILVVVVVLGALLYGALMLWAEVVKALGSL